MNNPFGKKVFADILDNPYLRTIYSNVLYAYAKSIIQGNSSDFENRTFELDDALNFANLLSLSTDSVLGDRHRFIAQEMVTLLHELYPDDSKVDLVTSQVLDNVGNYRGLELMKNIQPENSDLLDSLSKEYNRELMSIPAEPEKHFFLAQKRVYDKVKKGDLSFSGPTSMGKSFVMRMFIKEQVQNDEKKNFALIIPTKALINEVSSSIIQDLKKLLELKDYRVVTTAGDLALTKEHNFILVMTPERLSYLLCSCPHFRIDYIFIDEAHKISANEKRSAFYYKITELLLQRSNPPRFIFASPNIPNPQVYLDLINNKTTSFCFSSMFTPVSQEKFLIDLVGGDIAFYNHITDKLERLRDGAKDVNITDIIVFLGDNKQNLVYCHSKAHAVDFAIEYYKKLERDIPNQKLQTLANSIENEIHHDYYLAKLIRRGIAYHVGYLPSSIRLKIERYYREGLIKTIFCTSTLIEGVNLPADNLFITSTKNGQSNLQPVEFKNLLGRVGRIEYTLYGNVFVLCTEDSPRVKFEEILEEKVPDQTLSVVSALTTNQKKKIVENLLSGNIEIPRYPKSQTNENYDLVRKFSLILLKDIFADRQSTVMQEFDGLISEKQKIQIKQIFTQKNQVPDEDINTSCDQIINLHDAIVDGLKYPEIGTSGVDYDELVDFLNKLAVIFKWDKYDRKTLGYRNKKSNEFTHIRFYATVLRQWVQGYGLSNIVNKAIEYKENHPESGVWSGNYRISPEYDYSTKHKNYVISETLAVIDNVILFSISNYFLRFSTEYKTVFGEDSLPQDWYEYVEYGTTNLLTIFLQRSGYSREASSYIRQHREYIVVYEDSIKLKRSLLDCSDDNVKTESLDVIYNMPDLFEEESLAKDNE